MKILFYDKTLLTDFVYDGVEAEITTSQIIPMAEFYNKLGVVFVGKIGDKVLGVGGVYKLWSGTGGYFLFLNKIDPIHKRVVFKNIKNCLDMLVKRYEINNLIVECLDSSLKAKTLIKHLGFTKYKEHKMVVYTKTGDNL